MDMGLTFEKENESGNDISKPRYEPGDDICGSKKMRF